jgi:hypothetical protein
LRIKNPRKVYGGELFLFITPGADDNGKTHYISPQGVLFLSLTEKRNFGQLQSFLAFHEKNQIKYPIGIAPFIIVPAEHLDHIADDFG